MKPAVLFLLLFIFCDVFAQQKPFAIEAEVTGSFFTITFRKDSLVPPKRQGKTSFADGLSVNAYFLFTRPDTSLKIRTGIGYNETHFRMNKNNLGDFIVAIFSFGAQNRDSFQINNVDITSRYLNLPLGISYRLAKGRKKKVEAHCGLQLNSSFLISSRSKVFFVNSANHSAQQKQEVEKKYASTASKFFLHLQPRIDIKWSIIRNIGIAYNLLPLGLYINSPNKLIKANFMLGSGLGAFVNF